MREGRSERKKVGHMSWNRIGGQRHHTASDEQGIKKCDEWIEARRVNLGRYCRIWSSGAAKTRTK